jgi:hypothetical protein
MVDSTIATDQSVFGWATAPQEIANNNAITAMSFIGCPRLPDSVCQPVIARQCLLDRIDKICANLSRPTTNQSDRRQTDNGLTNNTTVGEKQ